MEDRIVLLEQVINTNYMFLFKSIEEFTSRGNITYLRSYWEFLRNLAYSQKRLKQVNTLLTDNVQENYLLMLRDIGKMYRKLNMVPAQLLKKRTLFEEIVR
ncbi:MAG: hypothetical protein QXM92_02745 [Candidatus Anstonellales archaeon]